MSSFTATKTEIIEYKDSNGVPFQPGDLLLIRVKTEDIVCRFVGLIEGYFTTETVDSAWNNKYRLGSLSNVTKISGVRPYPEDEPKCAVVEE